jgi:hypothetical protein
MGGMDGSVSLEAILWNIDLFSGTGGSLASFGGWPWFAAGSASFGNA